MVGWHQNATGDMANHCDLLFRWSKGNAENLVHSEVEKGARLTLVQRKRCQATFLLESRHTADGLPMATDGPTSSFHSETIGPRLFAIRSSQSRHPHPRASA